MFPEALELVLKHEGGYVDHPSDPGGETKYGISKRAYPDLDIKTLTVKMAGDIYHRDYWTKCRCDELPAPLALMVFDSSVNLGVRRACRWAQKISGATPDGVIGPKTLAAVHTAYTADPEGTLLAYYNTRQAFYERLKTFEVFGRGWTNRNNDILKEAKEWMTKY